MTDNIRTFLLFLAVVATIVIAGEVEAGNSVCKKQHNSRSEMVEGYKVYSYTCSNKDALPFYNGQMRPSRTSYMYKHGEGTEYSPEGDVVYKGGYRHGERKMVEEVNTHPTEIILLILSLLLAIAYVFRNKFTTAPSISVHNSPNTTINLEESNLIFKKLSKDGSLREFLKLANSLSFNIKEDNGTADKHRLDIIQENMNNFSDHTLYFVKVKNTFTNESFAKVGETSRSVENRFKGDEILVLEEIYSEYRLPKNLALLVEYYLIKSYRSTNNAATTMSGNSKFSGYTEVVDPRKIKEIRMIIKKLPAWKEETLEILKDIR